uniref:Uncharacterized protein n=1 Tax=Candidatus Methanogaster sp. ANME-2c ERB4 TaxID=2759911 RepID=A0A7G9Y8M3_9EURY|nr:hypothetical protein PNPCOBDL_00002 [Methanosarcinales archaeon ANME-2c ERB4]
MVHVTTLGHYQSIWRGYETIPEEMLEHDEIVRIPPRKRYALNIQVKEIRKAAPRIVEPDEP